MSRTEWIPVVIATVWILACAVAFVALGKAAGRASSGTGTNEAESRERALVTLRESRGGEWIVVNAAKVRSETPPFERWAVLCDRPERTAMKDAAVVELDARSGRVFMIRRPLPR